MPRFLCLVYYINSLSSSLFSFFLLILYPLLFFLLQVHMAEVIIPAVLILFMGVLYSQIVSTYGSNKKSGAALGTTVPGRTSLGSTGGAVGSSVSGKRHGGHSRGLRYVHAWDVLSFGNDYFGYLGRLCMLSIKPSTLKT